MKKLDTITVGELRELLEQYDDDQLVLKTSNYGDYICTEVAKDIVEPEERFVEYSEYHRSFTVIDCDDEEAGTGLRVIVI